jgi:hypothetical protein
MHLMSLDGCAIEKWGQRGDLSSHLSWLLQGRPLELAALSP